MVEFWDHGLIDTKVRNKAPILCRVRGMVVEITDKKVVLAHWTIYDRDKDTRDNNREEVVIVKNCITRWGIATVLKWHELA